MSSGDKEIVIFWFRRDLRLEDNCGLRHALDSGYKVLPLFIYDENILDNLEPDDRRISFLKEILDKLNTSLKKAGSGLFTVKGTPLKAFSEIKSRYDVKGVYFNRDYEPYAIIRDSEVTDYLKAGGIPAFSYRDQVIFEMDEVTKNDGKPYTVYTPYSVKWLAGFTKESITSFNSEKHLNALLQTDSENYFTPVKLGFKCPAIKIKSFNLSENQITGYHKTRDIPSVDGTSNLSPYLRFGTISIREVIRRTGDLNIVFLKELIWREFFMQVLFHFPHVAEKSFRPEFDRIEWINDEEKFQKWCDGKTGFPIVDAGMRELSETGHMHNRVRMITANFLTRHLLTDWRWGEAWFAEKLIDYDLSSNNGNWQWAAGSGCDAAQYFRIFNPWTQMKKFDPDMKYVRKWIPELDTPEYPEPIVDLSAVRERALAVYKAGIRS